MPNFDRHPAPWGAHHLLGSSSYMAADLAIDTDYLLIPPPPAVAAGEPPIIRECGLESALSPGLLRNDSGGDITDVEFFYRDSQGREAIMSTTATVADGSLRDLSPSSSPFFLGAEDQGIFVRFSAAGPVPADSVNGVGLFADVRDVLFLDTELSENQIAILAGAENISRIPLPALDAGTPSCLLNFDTGTPHTVDLFVTDGSETILLYSGLAVPDGEYLSMDELPPIPEGWSVLAALGEPLGGSGPVVARVFYIETNPVPVRPNQGGAY